MIVHFISTITVLSRYTDTNGYCLFESICCRDGRAFILCAGAFPFIGRPSPVTCECDHPSLIKIVYDQLKLNCHNSLCFYFCSPFQG